MSDKLIDKVNYPVDLRKLEVAQLKQFSKEP